MATTKDTKISMSTIGLKAALAALGIKQNSENDVATSVADSLEATMKSIKTSAKDSKPVKDSYGNSLMSIGTDDKVESFTNYGLSNNTLNWTLWMALYNDSWVFKRAIDKPSQDEIRCGITIQGDSNFEDVYHQYKKDTTDLIQLLQWGALFGGAVGVMMFDNFKDDDYARPISETKKKIEESKACKLYVTDRWYGVAVIGNDTVSDMTNMDFGKPKMYEITFADGKQIKVSHDYILRYEHRAAPKLVKNGQLQGWGYAEGSHILNELSRDDKLKASIQSLVDKSLIEVIKMPGMRGTFLGGDKENNQQMTERLEMVNWGRTFNSLTFLDIDDEYQQNTFGGLGGLSDLLAQNMWLVAAALEMDNTLFGDLKSGFSSDSDATERYANTIMNRCENYVRPVLEKWMSIQFIRYKIKDKIEFEFNSLLVKKQDKEKLEAMKNFKQLVGELMQDGVITLKQYARAMQQYIQKGIIDLGLDDDYIDSLDDKMAEEMEDIDLDEDEDKPNIDMFK